MVGGGGGLPKWQPSVAATVVTLQRGELLKGAGARCASVRQRVRRWEAVGVRASQERQNKKEQQPMKRLSPNAADTRMLG